MYAATSACRYSGSFRRSRKLLRFEFDKLPTSIRCILPVFLRGFQPSWRVVNCSFVREPKNHHKVALVVIPSRSKLLAFGPPFEFAQAIAVLDLVKMLFVPFNTRKFCQVPDPHTHVGACFGRSDKPNGDDPIFCSISPQLCESETRIGRIVSLLRHRIAKNS